MVLLATVILGIAGLCQADIRWSRDTISVPGRIKNPEAFAAAHRGASGLLSSPASAMRGSPAGSLAVDQILGRDLELFDRQTCPPTHPFPCAGRCCPVGSPVCCIAVNGGCCTSAKPVCQPNGCCATGTTECPNDTRTCRKPGETCCGNGFVCPSSKPVCSPGGLCCPSGTTLCPNDPTVCKELDEQCCGAGRVCPVWASCCGTNACCDSTNPEISQCCPGSTPDKDTCCGEYEVCCDGWCCPESSTCSSTPGYCNVPVLEFGYSPNNIISDLVENICLGIRRQIALGRPETTPNQQILTYYGPNSPNRELSDCRSSRGCCTGRTVPAGEPGAGDKATCDEYPFNSAIQGGADAHVACVSEHANSGGGDLIGRMVSGKHRGFKYALRVTGIDCTTVQESDVHGCNP